MNSPSSVSRRSFLALAAAAPLARAAPEATRVPVGLELYSVRNELTQDLLGTVRAVAKMGYEGVEFFSPYFEWTPAYAKEVRKLLDDLGIRCNKRKGGTQMPQISADQRKSASPSRIPARTWRFSSMSEPACMPAP